MIDVHLSDHDDNASKSRSEIHMMQIRIVVFVSIRKQPRASEYDTSSLAVLDHDNGKGRKTHFLQHMRWRTRGTPSPR